jgi:mannose-6-phosphate isomerase-like protein (cupin superfamily)
MQAFCLNRMQDLTQFMNMRSYLHTEKPMMHAFSKDKASPFEAPHGKIIYELIGRAVGETTERHSVAYVVIPSGKSSLLHYHPHAEESYYILQGEARMLLADEEAIVTPQQAVLIPAQKPHKIINIGESDLVFLAVCVPAWEPTGTVFIE